MMKNPEHQEAEKEKLSQGETVTSYAVEGRGERAQNLGLKSSAVSAPLYKRGSCS